MSDVVERAKAALDETKCTDAMMDFFRVGLVRELVAEVERLRVEKLGLEISESNLLVELRNEVERLRPRVIETVEQVDALPTLSIVRDEWTSAAGWHHSGIWERRGMEWHCIAAPVIPPGHPRPNIPARVLYTPEAK